MIDIAIVTLVWLLVGFSSFQVCWKDIVKGEVESKKLKGLLLLIGTAMGMLTFVLWVIMMVIGFVLLMISHAVVSVQDLLDD